jgi:hypothetical protein
MSRDVKRVRVKSQLPTKICVACQRPFTWRKKWERDWNDVRFCSERCRRTANRANKAKQS